jgi:hypothetical protein
MPPEVTLVRESPGIQPAACGNGPGEETRTAFPKWESPKKNPEKVGVFFEPEK